VGVSVGRAIAVRVKSTSTVWAMLVMICSGLRVGVEAAHAESSNAEIITAAEKTLENVLLIIKCSILRENYLIYAHDFLL
jgi:hypothetical protein